MQDIAKILLGFLAVGVVVGVLFLLFLWARGLANRPQVAGGGSHAGGDNFFVQILKHTNWKSPVHWVFGAVIILALLAWPGKFFWNQLTDPKHHPVHVGMPHGPPHSPSASGSATGPGAKDAIVGTTIVTLPQPGSRTLPPENSVAWSDPVAVPSLTIACDTGNYGAIEYHDRGFPLKNGDGHWHPGTSATDENGVHYRGKGTEESELSYRYKAFGGDCAT